MDGRRALQQSGRLPAAAGSAWRLLQGDTEGIPGAAVDVYGTWALVHDYGAGDGTIRVLAEHLLDLPAGLRGVYGVQRPRSSEPNRAGIHLAGERAEGDAVEVVEHGLRYPIRLAEGPATGLYLDQRDNRRWVADRVGGGRLLNTFAYTGSFGLTAAAVGATTTNVDLAKAAMRAARDLFTLNAFDPTGHRFLADDVFDVLPRLARRGEEFDAVLLDPPTFARGRRGSFSTERDYGQLIALAAPLVAAGGSLVAFSNTHRLTADAFDAAARCALAAVPGRWRMGERLGPSPDFPPPRGSEPHLKGRAWEREA